jgi:hypothetical protein
MFKSLENFLATFYVNYIKIVINIPSRLNQKTLNRFFKFNFLDKALFYEWFKACELINNL